MPKNLGLLLVVLTQLQNTHSHFYAGVLIELSYALETFLCSLIYSIGAAVSFESQVPILPF